MLRVQGAKLRTWLLQSNRNVCAANASRADVEFVQEFRFAHFHEVGRDVHADFGAGIGTQLLQQRVHDFAAGGKEALLDLGILHQGIEPASEFAHAAFAFLFFIWVDCIDGSLGVGEALVTGA